MLKMVPLGELISETQYGTAAPANTEGLGLPVLRMNNLTREGRIDLTDMKFVELDADEVDRFTVKKGDLLFNRTNSRDLVGKTAVWNHDEAVAFAGYLIRVRFYPARVIPEYVAAYLNSPYGKTALFGRAKPSVNMANINASDLRTIPIPLPSLEKQRRISDILEEADALRRMRTEAMRVANDVVPSIFSELFGDVIRNDRNWGTSPLHKVAQLDRGRSRNRPRNAPELYGGPYPFVQTGDISNANGWIESYTQTYSEAGLAQSRLWPKGTLCITIAANIAATAVLTFDACFPDSVVGLVPGDRLTTNYVRQWFVLKQRWLEEKAPQVAQKNINLELLNSLEIPVPPKALLLGYERHVENWRVIRRKQGQSQVELDNLFHSLLQQAFRGEL
jgi:type I restriction enzyme S subunit